MSTDAKQMDISAGGDAAAMAKLTALIKAAHAAEQRLYDFAPFYVELGRKDAETRQAALARATMPSTTYSAKHNVINVKPISESAFDGLKGNLIAFTGALEHDMIEALYSVVDKLKKGDLCVVRVPAGFFEKNPNIHPEFFSEPAKYPRADLKSGQDPLDGRPKGPKTAVRLIHHLGQAGQPIAANKQDTISFVKDWDHHYDFPADCDRCLDKETEGFDKYVLKDIFEDGVPRLIRA